VPVAESIKETLAKNRCAVSQALYQRRYPALKGNTKHGFNKIPFQFILGARESTDRAGTAI
jgi:hypothetical protein